MNESNIRSIAKTISCRITGSGATFLISYIVSGNIEIAGTIAMTQLMINTMLYYIHERLWNKISWQKNC